MLKRSVLGLSIFGVVFIMQACYYDNAEDLYPGSVNNEVGFAKDILPLMQTYCATNSNCHASGTPYPVFETYDQISAQAERIKLRAIEKNPSQMPPSGNAEPSSAELEKLKTWIDEGAQNN